MKYTEWVVGCCAGLGLLAAYSPTSRATVSPAFAEETTRLSRAFFEREVVASLIGGVGDLTVPAGPSPTTWQDKGIESDQPAPDPARGVPLADFRDRKQCLNFNDWSDSQLCFRVMPDVSNLGLNDREMQLTLGDGTGKYSLAQAERISPQEVRLHFVSAGQPKTSSSDDGKLVLVLRQI